MSVRKGMSRCPEFAPARACLRGGPGPGPRNHRHVPLLGSPVGSSKEPLVKASTVAIYLEIVPE